MKLLNYDYYPSLPFFFVLYESNKRMTITSGLGMLPRDFGVCFIPFHSDLRQKQRARAFLAGPYLKLISIKEPVTVSAACLPSQRNFNIATA